MKNVAWSEVRIGNATRFNEGVYLVARHRKSSQLFCITGTGFAQDRLEDGLKLQPPTASPASAL